MQVQVTNNMGSANPPELKVKTLRFHEPYYHFEINYCDKSTHLIESVSINVILDKENININELKEKAIQKAKSLLVTIIQG